MEDTTSAPPPTLGFFELQELQWKEERRAAEEARRKEEEQRTAETAKWKVEEEHRHAAEAARRQEEERLAVEAAKRKEEEDRAAIEAARRQEEEQLAVEAARRREEEERAAIEAARRQEEEKLRAAEAARRQEEEERLRAAEAARRQEEEEKLRAAEAARRLEEEEKLRAAEAARRREEEERAAMHAAAAVQPPAAAGHGQVAGIPGLGTASGLAVVARCAGYNIPHREKILSTGGEDSFFANTAKQTLGKPWLGAMGVADGVGAWEDRGVDAGLYARTIMQHCAAMAGPNTLEAQSLKEVLRYAQQNTKVLGSTTACVLRMEEGGKLTAINLGDCGFRILRGGQVVAQSTIQQWELNMPYQMADLDRFPDAETADHADLYEHAVQPGDVVVAATDGLFDNMWEDELSSIVMQFLATRPPGSPLSEDDSLDLARRLARKAYSNSTDSNYRSPWAVHEAEAEGTSEVTPGGKDDDITVVVALMQAGGS